MFLILPGFLNKLQKPHSADNVKIKIEKRVWGRLSNY